MLVNGLIDQGPMQQPQKLLVIPFAPDKHVPGHLRSRPWRSLAITTSTDALVSGSGHIEAAIIRDGYALVSAIDAHGGRTASGLPAHLRFAKMASLAAAIVLTLALVGGIWSQRPDMLAHREMLVASLME